VPFVLHPSIDPIPAPYQRAYQPLMQAHEALVTVAGDGNDLRATADYQRAMMAGGQARMTRETATCAGDDITAAEDDARAMRFADLPPQGFAFMTPLQRFDYKVRLAVLEVLDTKTAGTWNVNTALGHIAADVEGLTATARPRAEARQ
jgi:hypothetical protein